MTIIRLVLLLAVFVTTVMGQSPQAGDYTVGEILIQPEQGKAAALIKKIAKAHQTIIETDAVSGLLRVQVPVGTESGEIARWTADADVDYADRNGLGHGSLVPNDTWFTSQWHLRNLGGGGGTPGADVRATDAWDITTGSSSVLIAVLDTGIDSDHPDFIGRIDVDGFDFVNNDNDPEADHPHGTWVSGCLCANSNNSFGVTGMDWNCGLLPIKVLDANNAGTTFDLIQGLNYCATQNDLQIISMSLINYPGSTSLINALQFARNAGKILIAASGNGGIGNADISYPGASALTIAIGATTNTDSRAGFSGTGLALDFVAPGENIVTAAHNTSANQTATVSGTSFATPIVAGAVGLMFARAQQLGITPPTQDQVYNTLKLSAIDQVGPPNEDTFGRDNFFGHGRLDARGAVNAVALLDSCSNGAIGAGAGGPYDVAKVNGLAAEAGTRTIAVPVGAMLTLSVDVPPGLSGPGPVPPLFLLWAHSGTIGSANPIPIPVLNIDGEMCFDPTSPNTFVLFAGIAPWSTTTPPLPAGFAASLQGIMLENHQADLAVTNLVAFDPQQFPPPTILSLVSAAAPGQLVTITGTDFQAGLTLEVDGQTVAPVSIQPTSVDFVNPAALSCDTSLTITNPDGQSATAPFNISPVVSSVLSIGGTPAAGGNTLILLGSNFVSGLTVTIGGSPMQISTTSTASIVGILPAGSVGPAVIVVTTPHGCSTTSTLTYQ